MEEGGGGGLERVPDGAVLTLEDGPSRHSAGGSSVLMLGAADAADVAGAGRVRLLTNRAHEDAHVPSSSSSSSAGAAARESPSELLNPLDCYICKKPFIKLHFFYASLCPDCAAFNYSKRSEKADLRGRVVLVTGARQKIG